MMRAEVAESGVEEGGRLAELYRRHAPDATRLAYLLTGNAALAEDLAQDAFVRLYGRFRDLRHPDAFGAYLRRTIVNLANSHFRRAGVERRHLERERGRESHEPPPGARQEMWESLKRLSERQRAAIVLRYYEDLTEAQTADVLGCRIGTVKSLVSRGLDVLREEMSRGD